MNDFDEDMASLHEPTLDVDESIYWEIDLVYAQGDMV